MSLFGGDREDVLVQGAPKKQIFNSTSKEAKDADARCAAGTDLHHVVGFVFLVVWFFFFPRQKYKVQI